jgi:hypothetical protein
MSARPLPRRERLKRGDVRELDRFERLKAPLRSIESAEAARCVDSAESSRPARV